jgi:hypothetical protein
VALLDPISARAFGSDGVTLRPFAPALGEDFALLTPRDQPASRMAQDFIALFRRHHGRLGVIDGNR